MLIPSRKTSAANAAINKILKNSNEDLSWSEGDEDFA